MCNIDLIYLTSLANRTAALYSSLGIVMNLTRATSDFAENNLHFITLFLLTEELKLRCDAAENACSSICIASLHIACLGILISFIACKHSSYLNQCVYRSSGIDSSQPTQLFHKYCIISFATITTGESSPSGSNNCTLVASILRLGFFV